MSQPDAYRLVLKEELTQRCARNARYSLRSFARALEVSPSTLSRILSGQRRPSLELALDFARRLDLSADQRERLLSSVSAQGAASFAREFPAARELSPDLFRVISDWYHYAILELTFVEGFRSDPQWIAGQLGISATETKLAIDRLLELGLLRLHQRRLRKTDIVLTTQDKNLTSRAHKKRQHQILAKAQLSLAEDALDVRSMTTMTMAIDPAKLPEAKRMILAFNRELCRTLESGRQKQVYELAISLFPVQTGRSKA